MYLRDLLDMNEYSEMVDKGYINVRKHPELDLYISGYSPAAQFERLWNRSTMVCRGLITNGQDRVIARPWSKFFNINEFDLMIGLDDPVEVTDKMDGSLGILYLDPNGRPAISTRGSFASDQAIHATKILRSKYSHLYTESLEDYTYLFEIVYPENRILLNYGEQDDLILLGAVHVASGAYVGPQDAKTMLQWSGPTTRIMPYTTINEAMLDQSRPNAEGVVARSGNYMVKLKQPDYVQNHRLRFEMTPRRVWENLVSGKNIRSIVEPLPDEIQQEILDMAEELYSQFAILHMEIRQKHNSVRDIGTRAEQAKALQSYRHKWAVFGLLDGKPANDYVWKQIKP